MSDTPDQHCRTILLVGSSRGLGQAIAAEFVKKSWHVVGTVREDGHARLSSSPDCKRVRQPHNFAQMLPQRDTKRLLSAHLQALGVAVERQVELLTFTQRPSHVALVHGCPGSLTWWGGYVPSMPFTHNASRRHRIPRARYRVTNWAAYEAGLRRRGDLTV